MKQQKESNQAMTLLDFEFGVTDSPSPIKGARKKSGLADPESYGVTVAVQPSANLSERPAHNAR